MQARCHMWIEFVLDSRFCSECFSPDSPVFLPSQTPTFQQRDRGPALKPAKPGVTWLPLNILIYLFVCLFIVYVPCCSCSIRWCPSSPNTWHNPKEIWLIWSLFNVLNWMIYQQGTDHHQKDYHTLLQRFLWTSLHCYRCVYLETFIVPEVFVTMLNAAWQLKTVVAQKGQPCRIYLFCRYSERI